MYHHSTVHIVVGELRAFCQVIGRSEVIQTEWLKLQTQLHPEFDITNVLENAAGQTCKQLEESMKNLAPPKEMQGTGDDVADVLDMCRFGLEMSKDSMLGKDGSSYATVVGHALQDRSVSSAIAGDDNTATIKYGDHAYKVRRWTCYFCRFASSMNFVITYDLFVPLWGPTHPF